MQTIFTIRISCDPADADKVSGIVDRTVDSLDEVLCDPDRINADADATVARVSVERICPQTGRWYGRRISCADPASPTT
jgi:hypothetical protein